jgi:hypothetical protein
MDSFSLAFSVWSHNIDGTFALASTARRAFFLIDKTRLLYNLNLKLAPVIIDMGHKGIREDFDIWVVRGPEDFGH